MTKAFNKGFLLIPPPVDTLVDNSIWKHLKRKTTYKVRKIFQFKPDVEGYKIQDNEILLDGKIRIIAQCKTPIKSGTNLVFYECQSDIVETYWVRPVNEFLDGRFEFLGGGE